MENWQEELNKIETSGLSIAQYCRENGLKPHTVRYWKQKQNQEHGHSNFVRINTQTNTAVEISYPNGIKLKLGSGFSIKDLKTLLHV